MRLVLSIVFLPVLLSAADLSVGGWNAVGPGAAVTTSDGVLTFRYDADAAQRSIAVLPARGLPLAEMKALRFEVKTDSPFAVAFVMSEKGRNFSAVVWSGGGWQQVLLTPADFSSDKGGTLDLSLVENLAITDFTKLAGSPQNSEVYVESHKGVHTIQLRNVQTVEAPQSAWFGFGGATFEQKEAATVIRYKPVDDRWISFTRVMSAGNQSGATHLALDIQSQRDAQLVISIHAGDERHNVDFFVPAGTAIEHREVVLSAFSNPKLDPGAVRSITILDVGGDTTANTITIRDLRFVTR
jgi:hypothetical protein